MSDAVWFVTAGAGVLALAAELLHARRLRRLSRLAFGPSGRPAGWVGAVPWLRVAATAALAFGLTVLLTAPPRVHRAGSPSEHEFRHLVLVLDVSPSMRLVDAGPDRKQARMARARVVLESLFGRVAIGRYKISVIATYNGALPVVEDTLDAEVVRNVLGDLPMHYAFNPGETRLFDGIGKAAEIAAKWQPASTLMIVVSDGDTVPPTGMPVLPPSIAGVLVIGVGDPLAGSFIDGRQSRQDTSSLRQLALRLGGVYQDGNLRQVSSAAIRQVTSATALKPIERWGLREYALLACLCGAAALALLPLLLHLAGTNWDPGPGARPARVAAARPGKNGANPSTGASDTVAATSAPRRVGRAQDQMEESIG